MHLEKPQTSTSGTTPIVSPISSGSGELAREPFRVDQLGYRTVQEIVQEQVDEAVDAPVAQALSRGRVHCPSTGVGSPTQVIHS